MSKFFWVAQDWVLESLVAFLDILYSSKTFSIEANKMLWSPTCNYRFEVKRYCDILQFGESSLIYWKSIWKVKAPPCIVFFTWMAALGKVLTINNLRRQGLTLVN
jgi:hypothetical protein